MGQQAAQLWFQYPGQDGQPKPFNLLESVYECVAEFALGYQHF